MKDPMPVLLFSGDTLVHDLEPNGRLSTILSHMLDHWLDSENQSARGQFDSKKLSQAIGDRDNTVFFPPPSFFPGCIKEESGEDGDKLQLADVTVKLFLPDQSTAASAAMAIREALNAHMQYLKRQKFKSLIIAVEGLSFADSLPKDGVDDNDELAEIWRQVTHISSEMAAIEDYGVSELSTGRLKSLFNKIDLFNDSSVPYPSIDHINAADCCALPPGLLLFSRQKHIRLLANHDPEKMLCGDEINHLFDKIGIKGAGGQPIKWNWILRMTAVVPNRQVLTANKYLVSIST